MRLFHKIIFFFFIDKELYFLSPFYFILVKKNIKYKLSRGGWKDMIGCVVFNCRILGYLK